MVTKRTMYESDHGVLFPTRDAAERHNEIVEITQYINENQIFGSSQSSIDGEQFMDWCTENPRIFVKLLPKPETRAPKCPQCGCEDWMNAGPDMDKHATTRICSKCNNKYDTVKIRKVKNGD